MQKLQISAIILSVLLLAGLYFMGNFTGKGKTAAAANTMQAADGGHNPGGIPDFDFKAYTRESETKLTATERSTVESLGKKAEATPSAVTYKDVAEFWEKEKNLAMAAYYYKKAAFLENTEKSITFAGNLYMAVLQRTEQPSMRKWQALEAIDCYTKALALNPGNTDTKIALATCYTEGTGETMKGVTLLREVTQADSTNIPANVILGKLAIQSGQFDKAIRRFELVLSLKPAHTEALYFLAEAYKGSGNTKKAIELFEQCKRLVNNPDFSREIDSYIKTFK